MTEKSEQKEKKKLHKVIGAGVGWVIAGPVGAALGLLVGHTVEKNPELLEKHLMGDGLKPHYDVLQVPYSAGREEIKSAYKRLARKYHPDKFADADPVIEELAREKMSKINEAYRVVMDRTKKRVKRRI